MITVAMTLCGGEDQPAALLQFTEREVPTYAAMQRADVAKKPAPERCNCFDALRHTAARLAVVAKDMTALEQAEWHLERSGRGKKI